MSLTQAHNSILARYGGTITITRGVKSVSVSGANFHRDREQGLAGSATQNAPAYHIDNAIASSSLVKPQAKDKVVDGSNTYTVNSVEAKVVYGKIVGWRLRVGG